MKIDKGLYWEKVVEHYYDNVKWDGGPDNIYDWLEQEYSIKSDTGSQVLEFLDDKKGTWFVLKWS